MKRRHFRSIGFLIAIIAIVALLVPGVSKAVEELAPLEVNKPSNEVLEINKPEEFNGLEVNKDVYEETKEEPIIEEGKPEESNDETYINDITPSTNAPSLLIDGKTVEEFFEPYVEVLGEDISYGNLVTGNYILDNSVTEVELEKLEDLGATTFKSNLVEEVKARANGYAPDVKEDWPKITLDGDIAYCLNIKRKVPQNIPYVQTSTVPDLKKNFTLEQINVMLMHAYPSDASGMVAAYGISAQTARENTQKAVWQMSDDGGLLSPVNTAYTNALIAKGDKLEYPWKDFSMSTSTLNFTDKGSYWESQSITTSGGPGRFTIPNNGTIYAVNSGGSTTTDFAIGDSFKVRVAKTHDGSVNLNLTAKYNAKAVTWWKPTVGPDSEYGYQYLSRTLNDPVMRVKPLAGAVQGRGGINVTKTNSTTGAGVPGATIAVFNSGGGEVARKVTNGSGVAEFTDLPVASYTVKEVIAPAGYVLNSQAYSTTVGAATTQSVSIPNTPIVGSLKIIKKDTETQAPLAGAKFDIKQNGRIVGQGTTQQNGELVISNLAYGTYDYVETQAPAGYVLGNVQGSFTIDNHGEVEVINATNTKIKGSIEVIKEDAETKAKLKGATFGLFKDNLKVEEKTTDNSGIVTFTNVPYGNYEIRELTPPTGFLQNSSPQRVSVTTNGHKYSVKFENTPIKGHIELLKKDSETQKPLYNAEFALYQDGRELQRKSTDNSGIVRFENLRYGDYTVKEVTPPEGFLLNKTVLDVEVRDNGKTYKLEMVDEPIKGHIELLKLDSEYVIAPMNSVVNDIVFDIPNEGRLEGARFGLFQDGRQIKEATTNSQGIIRFEDLRYGRYTVRELEPKTGFLLNEKEFVIDITEHGKTYYIEAKNDVIKGNIQLIKKDSETKEPLANAVFGLFLNDKKLAEATTDDRGIVRFENLRYGDYQVKELTPPEGFLLNDTVLDVQVREHGRTYELEMTNEPIKAPIEVTKVETETNMFIEGVTFGIFKGEELLEEITTDNRGFAKSKDYRYGDYILQELSAPDKYVVNPEKVPVQIREHQKPVTFTRTNDVKVSDFTITKTKEGSDVPIKDVTYLIEDAYNFRRTLTTDDNGEAHTELPYGDYILTEVGTPDNYVRDTRPYTISPRGEDTLDFNHTNKEKQGKVRVVKFDDITKEKLANVKFDIFNSNDTKVGSMTTNENGESTSNYLPYGRYYLIESAPLNDYLPNTRKYEFEITSDEQIITINVYNSPKLGNIEIIKKDAENGNPIENVVFGVFDANGEMLDKITTGTNGKAYSRGLRLGNYTVRELSTPPQYNLNETVWDVEITDHKQIVKLEVENTPVKGKIAVKKIDFDNNNLPIANAEFTIFSDKECTKPIETIITNEDGYAESKELRYGRYFIKETKISDNYWISEEVKEIFVSSHMQTYTFNLTNEVRKSMLSILKRDEKTGELLKDITFRVSSLTDENFEPVEITTSETGIARTDLLVYGTYRIEEISAPRKYLLAEPIDVKVDGNQASIGKPLEPDVIEVPIFNTPKESSLQIEKVYKTTDMEMESKKIKTPYLNLPYSKEPISEYPLSNVTFEIFKLAGDKLYTDIANEIIEPDGVEEIEKEEKVDTTLPDEDIEDEVTWESLGIYTTDLNGLIRLDNLEWGSYKIVESIPQGLEGNKEIIVNLTGQGEVENLKIYNTSKKGLFELYKTDVNGHPIEGVVFDILDEEGDLIKTCTTDKNGKFDIELEVGNYYYKEVSVPEVPNGRYVFDDTPVPFEITDEALVFSAKVENDFARLPKTSKAYRDNSFSLSVAFSVLIMLVLIGMIVKRRKA